MAAILSGKMKRKDLEEVFNGFSEFSLSSPAKKIRRPDAELQPIMEEEDPRDEMIAGSSVPELGSAMTDDAEPVPALNEERALVLYKSVEPQLLLSPGQSNVPFRVSSDLIHGLKNQALQSGNQMPIEEKSVGFHKSLAVVPWVPNQGPMAITGSREAELLFREPMEAGEVESTSMEVEEDKEQAAIDGVGVEGFHQWQQHCMTPHLPANSSTPIMWPQQNAYSLPFWQWIFQQKY